MSQNLKGVDIYHCPFFEVDSNDNLKFISGKFYGRTPDSFNNINSIYDVIRYCMWIIKKKDSLDISKYCAISYINRVGEKLLKIESEYRKLLRKQDVKKENNLKNSINKPGKTYI